MSSRTKTLGELLARAARHGSLSVRVSLIAEIVSYEASTRLAVVQPVLAGVTGDPLPQIQDVPVQWPGGGGHSFQAKLSEGDFVTLIVTDYSHYDWHDGVDNADSSRFHRSHDITDAIAIPVMIRMSDGSVPTSNLESWFGKDQDTLVGIGADGTVRLGSENPGDWVALAKNTETRLANIEAYLILLDVWSRTVVPPYAGITPPGATVPFPGLPTPPVTSSKVKCK